VEVRNAAVRDENGWQKMTGKLAVPTFSDAPGDYNRLYFDDLVRSLNVFVTQQTNPGPIRGDTLVLTNLPTNGNGLETGSVYNDNGTLKIVLSNIGYGPSFSMTGSVGTITVTTA
jgi:hypothetical protein